MNALRGVIEGGLLGRLDTSRIGIIVRGRAASDAESLVRSACGRDVLLASTDLGCYQGGASRLALVHLQQELTQMSSNAR